MKGWDTREGRALAAMCAAACGAGTADTSVHDDLDWPDFLALADRHKVAPLLGHLVGGDRSPRVPEQVREDLTRAFQLSTFRALGQVSVLDRILAAFAAGGISAISLKGVSLAARYYPALGARYSGDLDVLVAQGQIAPAGEILRDLSCRQISTRTHRELRPGEDDVGFEHHQMFISPEGHAIELHYSLHPNDALLPSDLQEWARGGSVTQICGRSVSVLPDHVLFAYLCAHGARHQWKRLQWLCDLAMLATRSSPADRGQWVANAKRLGLWPVVLQTQSMAEVFLGSSLGEEFRARRTSLRLGFLTHRAGQAIRGDLGPYPEKSTGRADIALRLYRLLLAPSLRYVLSEIGRTGSAMLARARGLSSGCILFLP